jgi:Winged helix DNA-binding domain
VAPERLSLRALNRATLARQLLLERRDMPALDAVEHLVGLQAQVPLDPYTALWSRLSGFRPAALAGQIEERGAVRTVVMRATIHLVSAPDALELRPLVQPVLEAELSRHRDHAPRLAGADLAPVLDAARAAMAERPLTGPQLRALMAARFPRHDPAALAYACRCLLPLVQVPPRGLWGRAGQVTVTTAEAWLGRPLAAAPSIDAVALRYLAAFGPATAADLATWSGLAAMGAVLERLRPQLRAVRDERGRELLDLPDAPRPDPATPAPPRFLPQYDNVLLSHADRARFVAAPDRARLSAAGGVGWGSVLVDGALRAVWRLERDRASGRAALTVRHLGIPKRAAASVAAEGRRLLRLLAADAGGREVRLVAVP